MQPTAGHFHNYVPHRDAHLVACSLVIMPYNQSFGLDGDSVRRYQQSGKFARSDPKDFTMLDKWRFCVITEVVAGNGKHKQGTHSGVLQRK